MNGTPYYDTTVGRKHNYWKQFDDLPRETKDINQARRDLQKYGFCLIEDAMSERQRAYMRDRLEEQAEAERECGLADMTPHFHIMWTLVNKGDCFAKCIEFNSEWVQGGPLIEQLNNELLGRGHYAYSFASNIARPRQLSPEPAPGFRRDSPDPDPRRAHTGEHRLHHAGHERGQRRHAGHPHQPPARVVSSPRGGSRAPCRPPSTSKPRAAPSC